MLLNCRVLELTFDANRNILLIPTSVKRIARNVRQKCNRSNYSRDNKQSENGLLSQMKNDSYRVFLCSVHAVIFQDWIFAVEDLLGAYTQSRILL
jgi:hypothetical protein